MDRCCSDNFNTGNTCDSKIKLVCSYFGVEGLTHVYILIRHLIRNELKA